MTEKEVLEWMPEINLIHSADLQRKCIACWKQVLEMGGWEEKGVRNCSLGVGLVAEDCPEKSIDHCRRVVRVCETVWNEIGGWANEIGKLDHDTLIAGAVLHDIGKFLEYDYQDGKGCHAKNGHFFRHVIGGAYVAKLNDLPDEIVYIVLAHSDAQSPEGNKAFQTPELMMLKKLDHMCYMFAQMQYPV